MERTDLKVVKDLHVNRVMLVRETPSPIQENGLLEPIPLRKARHLDVDEILKRSLPMAVRASTHEK